MDAFIIRNYDVDALDSPANALSALTSSNNNIDGTAAAAAAPPPPPTPTTTNNNDDKDVDEGILHTVEEKKDDDEGNRNNNNGSNMIDDKIDHNDNNNNDNNNDNLVLDDILMNDLQGPTSTSSDYENNIKEDNDNGIDHNCNDGNSRMIDDKVIDHNDNTNNDKSDNLELDAILVNDLRGVTLTSPDNNNNIPSVQDTNTTTTITEKMVINKLKTIIASSLDDDDNTATETTTSNTYSNNSTNDDDMNDNVVIHTDVVDNDVDNDEFHHDTTTMNDVAASTAKMEEFEHPEIESRQEHVGILSVRQSFGESGDMQPPGTLDKIDENLPIEGHISELAHIAESSASFSEDVPRRLSYVKSIVKNVDEHGSPTPSTKKNIPNVPEINVQEGYVKTIKQDVENRATRASSLDNRKVNVLVHVEEGMVKAVVDDVEKRVTNPSVVNLLPFEDDSISEKHVFLSKEALERLTVPPLRLASSDDDKNSHRNSTPKTKNTDSSQEDTKHSGTDDMQLVFHSVQDERSSICFIPQPASHVESTPIHDRVVMCHQGSSLSTPTPPMSLVQQYQGQETPNSYARSVSFNDSGSVRSDVFSTVSNLSFPTNSLGSVAGIGIHTSPATKRSSSFGAFSTNTPMSESSRGRRRISDMIRRDLWSSEEKIVEDALFELADKAASDSQYRNAIARTGGLLAIVRSMEQHDSCPGIQVAGCRALEKLALETENELAIGEVGGVDAVLAAMMQHVGNSFVQEAAWSALWNLTCGNACDEMTTDTEGGMHAIVACMKQHSNHPEVQRNACGALTNLCLQNDERLRALADADGFVAIATALQDHWENESVRKEASHALTSLLEKSMSYDAQMDDDSL